MILLKARLMIATYQKYYLQAPVLITAIAFTSFGGKMSVVKLS